MWNVLSDLLTFLQDGGLADLATGVSGQIDHQRLEMIKPLLWREKWRGRRDGGGGMEGKEEWRRMRMRSEGDYTIMFSNHFV